MPKKADKDPHARHTVVWTMVGSLAAVAAAIIAYFQLVKKDPLPTQTTILTNIIFNASGGTDVPAKSLPVVTPTNLPAPQPVLKKPTLTDAERQLLEQAQQEGEIKLLLAPFLVTSDPAKKPSYSLLKPMLKPDAAGLDKIYLYLRQTNNAGGPWIEAAPSRTFYRGVAPGTLATDWSDDEPTKQLLTERQQVLLKFIPVLLKAGELGP